MYDENLEPVNLAFAGITWHSKGYQIAAGYDPFSYTCGVSANVFNKSTSGNSSFLLSANASFEQNKFRQTEDELSLDYKIPVFTHSNIVLSSDTKYFYGKPDRFKIFQVQPDFSDMQIFFNTQKVLLSSIHKTASNIHQKSGAYVGILQNYAYEEVFNSKLNYGCNFGFTTGFAISSILPFENPNNFCINLPLSVNVELFPDIFNFASCSAKLILFSMEVQKGTKNFFIPLYLNRVYLTGLYKCAVSYSTYQNMAIAKLNNIGTLLKDSTFSDQVGFGANIGFTLNTGDLHQTGCIDIGINVLFDINSPNSKKNNMHLNLSTNLVF